MDNNIIPEIIPTIDEIKQYLDDYGWKYKEDVSQGQRYLVASLELENKKAILITFGISGHFVMVSTNGLYESVSTKHALELLGLNDGVKLVKVFTVPTESTDEKMTVDVGFELYGEAWNKETFMTFMDMLSLGIEKVMNYFYDKKIDGITNFIEIKNNKE